MSSKTELNIAQRVALEIVWALSWAIAHSPHWFRYRVLARIVCFMMRDVIRYRRKVVDENLANAFPEKSIAERRKIARDFYTIFSEVFISTLSLAKEDPEDDTIVVEKDDDVSRYFDIREERRTNGIVLSAHFGLWEYLVFAGKHFDRYAVAIYHKLENPIFEELFLRLRTHKNVVMQPIAEATRYAIKNMEGVDGKYFLMGLLADQAPPRRANAKWYKFLNQDTQFYDGGEKMATKLGLNVIFTYQERVAPGRYRFIIEPIYGGHEPIEQGVITDQYVKRLECVIRENPHMWLWSHRRWKRKKLSHE